MVDPFASARHKLSRAKKYLAKLDRRAEISIKNQTYELFSEPDPDKPELIKYKMRMTKKLPQAISDLTGDVVDNLRAALDHAMYGVAVAAGCAKPRNAYFPFSGDAASFENNLKGRCADVPKEIWPLLRSYEPYQGGSDLLFALNELCIANKHKLIIPVGAVKVFAGVSAEGTGFWSMPYTPVWDGDKNEMELFTLHRDATVKFKSNFEFASFIAFGEVGAASGKAAIPNLVAAVEAVEMILNEVAAEAKRLGFVK